MVVMVTTGLRLMTMIGVTAFILGRPMAFVRTMTRILDYFPSPLPQFIFLFFFILEGSNWFQSLLHEIFFECFDEARGVMIDGPLDLVCVIKFQGFDRMLTHGRLWRCFLTIQDFVPDLFVVDHLGVASKPLALEQSSFGVLFSSVRILRLFRRILIWGLHD